ncbi:MAG TPA: hypothetical protein VLG11_04920 [Candidatus Saccharimonadales bacterium]|nr:hypothetical protein [Candidatus Saccharimonadales bacterium]
MISLNRNPAYRNHNIPLNPDYYYRGLIVPNYEGLWAPPDEAGNQIMVGYGKGGTTRLSFQRGYPNDLYVNGIVKADTLIVGGPNLPVSQEEAESGYAYVDQLVRAEVESGEVPLAVYQRQALGGAALHDVHVWEKVFDSFPPQVA